MEYLRFLVSTYYDYQKLRIALENRMRSLPEDLAEKSFFNVLMNEALNFEKRVEEEIKREVKKEELYEKYLKHIKGVGPVMSACLIAWLAKPRTVVMWEKGKRKKVVTLEPVMKVANKPSQLFKYSGVAPGCRRVAGKRIEYNPKIKTLMYKLFLQLLKARGAYYQLYLQEKKRYEKRCPEPEKGSKKLKVHLTVKNIVMRRFLLNLWKVYRRLNNLPITQPYPGLKGHYIEPVFVDASGEKVYLDWVEG
ncbi:MAG TPA: hypothetical protein ENG66_05200, partial [Thermococcus sp.]|nr:hypothetical protein [Thermococcus sp.]